MSSQFYPRLCHIKKWPDFQGYGFNLHAEKDRKGQYIGQIDAGSPAEAGGLKDGDRIIEINGSNIEEDSHQQVIQKIKAGGDETHMLVLDRAADNYYKSKGINVNGRMDNVRTITTPARSKFFFFFYTIFSVFSQEKYMFTTPCCTFHFPACQIRHVCSKGSTFGHQLNNKQ